MENHNSILLRVYRVFYQNIPTFKNCLLSGLKYNSTWFVQGRPRVIKRKWYDRLLRGLKGGKIIIGNDFKCNNTITSNSIGLIQPCVFNISMESAVIKIGNNVGISGATINAALSVEIEDNVSIGSGCLITDTDSHPLDYEARIQDDNTKTLASPIVLKEGCFIGARSIILKGVTIGEHSIIGAGSVVTKPIPANCIACGNPARVVKSINNTFVSPLLPQIVTDGAEP